MADTVILAEQTLTFTVEGGFGQATMTPAPFVLTDGETYRVELDSGEYELVCAPDVDTGWPALMYFVTDENETPTSGFAILYGSEEATAMEGGFVGVTVMSNDETHTLAIYHVAEETNTGGGGQTTTGANIVLRDRNGKEVQYPGVSYIKVNTVDGGTQGFAAYDPETLKAENIKNGVTVGDVEGALSVPELLEDMPIALDFSNGDMEITAQDGYAVKSAVIQKPANLVPGNIAKDVDIAGVVGTAESGGGANIRPAMLVYVETQATFGRNNGTRIFSFSKQVLPEVTVIDAFGSSASHSIVSTGSDSASPTTIRPTGKIGTYEMSESGDYVKIAGRMLQSYSTSYNVPFATWGILFHLQGLYIRNIDKDNFELYADETFVSSLVNTMVAEKFVSVDFSGVMRTSLSTEHVPLSTNFKRFVVPATIESMSLSIFNNRAGLEEIDFSKCTSVPTTSSVSLPTGVSENLQIKVPAALYDEWIAATNWSSLASYIVPV